MNNYSYSNIFLKSIFWRQISEVMHHGVDSLFNVIGTIISTKKINIPFKNFILDNVSSFIFLFLFTLLLICINTFLLMYVKINIVFLIFLQLLIQLFLIKILLPHEYIVIKDKIAQFLNS